MNIKILTQRGEIFDVDSEILSRVGKQNLLTFLCRRESHRKIRARGFHPSDDDVERIATEMKLSEQFARFPGGCGYRDMELRVFRGHLLSEGMARRLAEIQQVDVSDINFHARAVANLREMWEFSCRISDAKPEEWFRR